MPAWFGKAPCRAVRSSPLAWQWSRGRFKALASNCWACVCREVPCSTPLAPMAAAITLRFSGGDPVAAMALLKLERMACSKRASASAVSRWQTPLPLPSPIVESPFPSQRLSRQRVWVWPASKPASNTPLMGYPGIESCSPGAGPGWPDRTSPPAGLQA